MRGKRIAKIVIALAIVGGYVAFKDDIAKLWQDFHVKLVEHPTPKKTVWLDQGISKEKLSWFYHADQGTRTFGFPYEWLMALEQPTIPWLLFTEVDLFSDTAYLDRYGFIADTIIPGKKALPIGFAQGGPMLDPTGAPWRNPRNKQGHDRCRPDLRGLPHRQLHLQGHRCRHRRRTGAHRPVQDEAGNGHLALADALPGPAGSTASPSASLARTPPSTTARR